MNLVEKEFQEKNANSEVSFEFKSELILKSLTKREALAIYKAIKPETEVEISSRGKTEIILDDDNFIRMIFSAADFISLRAMLGSYLRWIEAVLSSLNLIEGKFL
ncbi:MAG: hypothetical protein EAX90_02300 [Candidatus Heimdallarchaeota archaeon]|nr:hypothetical protein [Candidatus Heimdallarchaeota archaeon]